MKKLYLLALLALTSLAFTSCGDDDDDNNNPANSQITLKTPAFKDVAAKYILQSPVSVILENGKHVLLKKLEITESGNYLISYEDLDLSRSTRAGNPLLEYLTGIVKVMPDGSLQLTGFGSIYISINGSNYHLTLIPTGDGQIEFDVVKADLVPTSDLTNYLCRTWTVENTRVRGVIDGATVARDFPGTCNINDLIAYAKERGAKIDDEVAANTIVNGVTFTSSGTYFINYANGKFDVGEWHWTYQTTGSGKLAYSWDDSSMGTSLESGDASVDFVEGTKCKLTLAASIPGSTVEVVYTMH